MLKQIRALFAGMLLATLIITTLTVFAQTKNENKESIEVIFNYSNFKINGKYVNADSLYYNGKNYLPISDIAKYLDKEVTWDSNHNIVNVDNLEYKELKN